MNGGGHMREREEEQRVQRSGGMREPGRADEPGGGWHGQTAEGKRKVRGGAWLEKGRTVICIFWKAIGRFPLHTSVSIITMPGSDCVASLPQIFHCSQLPITVVLKVREFWKGRGCFGPGDRQGLLAFGGVGVR